MSSKNKVTDSGIEIKDVYTAGRPDEELPGHFPFTRGIQKNMYRGKLWTMRQYAGFSTAAESNKRYRYLLAHGTTGLSIAFDLPTQIGYDSDHELAEGEVGKVGVAIDSLHDMEILLDGIDLEEVSASMTINATAPILLAMYIAVARKKGHSLAKLSGTVQNDILKEYVARGTYIYPPEQSLRLIADTFEYCAKEVPLWNTISVSGYHIREAGANAVQELAFTLANGKEYIKAGIERGLDINIFPKRISFFFNCHNNFFEELAKFRAARRMWATIIKQFGASQEAAQKLRFHAQTGGSTLTAQQPLNNIARVTMQGLAAVLGGAQSLHTNGYDEALSLPGEKAAQIALRTQQIIAYETGVADTADPLAGSYFVESLTDELETLAWQYIENIDAMGGAVHAIEAGYMQNEIAKSAYKYQQAIENGERIIVGVNKFTTEEKLVEEPFRVDERSEKSQIESLKKLKAERNNELVREALNKLSDATRTANNLIPFILEAVEAYATLGEIADTLRSQFGEY
ncbi:methylmalonyl-CoA mutase [Pedobacter sp. HMF7647]|uniref:Methylmalonyl-CoA mutase n=1 Tax=Hufsiella arboris TaxID=2695275 RepID=A0A7K1YBB5_9SPHI|nr:methylmalonyl-CoA mutase family protein [Hufsiella arboris]MXV51887.1 methylmalonyl-CoA mutase [Hufsiella arboris]